MREPLTLLEKMVGPGDPSKNPPSDRLHPTLAERAPDRAIRSSPHLVRKTVRFPVIRVMPRYVSVGVNRGQEPLIGLGNRPPTMLSRGRGPWFKSTCAH